MLTLTSYSLRLSLAPSIGAGITDFSLKSPDGAFTPLMRRAAPDEPNASNFASFIMAPWVNRIRNGRFSFDGKDHTLRTNTPDNMAQHGDIRKRPWQLTMSATNAATLEFDSRDHPDTNWPWPFSARAIYTLLGTDRGGQARIDLLIRNLSNEIMPTACGHHPYFMRTLWNKGGGDHLHLQVPVAARYPLESGCATGAPTQDDLTRQLRTGTPLPPHPIDDVFIADTLTQNTAELHWPASKVRLRINASPNMSHWVVYAPGTPALRAGSSPSSFSPLPYIAVEPQSAVNDALNLANKHIYGTGTILLNPREELATTCMFEVKAE